MGKLAAVNGYQVGSANQHLQSRGPGGVVNQQQPLWFMDGASAQLYRIYGGFVNTGALSNSGVQPKAPHNG